MRGEARPNSTTYMQISGNESWIRGTRREANNLFSAPAILAAILFDKVNSIDKILALVDVYCP